VLASFLITGSVSWLYYSDRLMEFPVGVFGIALATVILPSLSAKHANRSHEEFSRLLDFGLRWAVVICIPAAVALVLLAGPLITTIYHHGRFTPEDVRMSASALVAFAVGLPAIILIKVLAPGFYARQDTKTPMRIGVVAMLVNVAVGVTLIFPLKHIGLALAVSVSALVNAGLLYVWLRRHDAYRPQSGWRRFLLQTFLASAAMGVLLYWGAGDVGTWLETGAWARIGRLAFWVTAGILVYGASILALGLRPAQLVVRREAGMFRGDE
jgi:putative peptidoglycan lipid II flippase